MDSSASTRRTIRGGLIVFSLGHLCADVCSSALWSLLPFLVVDRHYDYAAAGVFALIASVSNGLAQPLCGVVGDRSEATWLMPTGLVVGGIGMTAVGWASGYPFTLLAVGICAVGVAAYHPEGARWARFTAGSSVSSDMSIFSAGGGVGWALGPLVVIVAVVPFGLRGTPLVALIPVAAAAGVLFVVRRLRLRLPAHEQRRSLLAGRAHQWSAFSRLLILYCISNGITSGLLVYLPLYLVNARGTSPGKSNVMTSVLLAAGAGGTLLGGFAAEHFGRRLALVVPQLVLMPAIALLPALSYAAMIPLVVVVGLAMNTNMSIALVLAQEYLPARMGLATGLTVGFCAGAGGLIVAVLGPLGDSVGPSAVLYVLAALPLAVAVVSMSLPSLGASLPGFQKSAG